MFFFMRHPLLLLSVLGRVAGISMILCAELRNKKSRVAKNCAKSVEFLLKTSLSLALLFANTSQTAQSHLFPRETEEKKVILNP